LTDQLKALDAPLEELVGVDLAVAVLVDLRHHGVHVEVA
jgi:hypothetical protein